MRVCLEVVLRKVRIGNLVARCDSDVLVTNWLVSSLCVTLV